MSGGFEFYHRSFQDYLAALALTDLPNWQDEIDDLLKQKRGQDWWSEVFMLLISAKIYGNDKPGAIGLLRRFIPQKLEFNQMTGGQWDSMFLAGAAVAEQKQQLETYYRKNAHYRELFDDLMRHLLRIVKQEYGLAVLVRAKAGRLLGELGDPRKGVAWLRDEASNPLWIESGDQRYRIPDIDWVEVQAGCLQMGSADNDSKAYDYEKPLHPVEVGGFFISRYAITNAQYQCFVEAGGYEQTRYWESPAAALDWLNGKAPNLSLLDDNPDYKKAVQAFLEQEKTRRLPWFWEQSKWNNPNHPVVGVSWYEALAFCRWLSENLAHIDKPRDGRCTVAH